MSTSGGSPAVVSGPIRVILLAASELLAQLVGFQRQALDVGDGQIEVLGEVLVVAAQCGVVLLELRVPGGVAGLVRWWGGCGAELVDDVGEVAPEGGIGQAEPGGQGQDAGVAAGGVGVGFELGHLDALATAFMYDYRSPAARPDDPYRGGGYLNRAGDQWPPSLKQLPAAVKNIWERYAAAAATPLAQAKLVPQHRLLTADSPTVIDVAH